MKQTNRWMLAAVMAVFPFMSPLAVAELKWREAPLYGTVNLTAGFQPDPHTVSVDAGGSTRARDAVNSSCAGYVHADEPDVDLNYTAGQYPLYIYAVSDTDTTLVIYDANGNWHCNDDFSGDSNGNPGIVFQSPPSGNYNIWVGTYERMDSNPSASLRISEARPVWGEVATSTPGSSQASRRAVDTIEWGDDGSRWAHDGECDDPRFAGPGAHGNNLAEDRYHDATDCRRLYEQGQIYLR